MNETIEKMGAKAGSHSFTWASVLVSAPSLIAMFLTAATFIPILYMAHSLGSFVGNHDEVERLEALGSIITGLSASITFIWIVATFMLQMRELSAQRHEIALQREAQQLTSISLKIQATILLKEHLSHELTLIIRNILSLLLSKEQISDFTTVTDSFTQETLQRLDSIYASGNKDTFFLFLLDRLDIQAELKTNLLNPLSKDLFASFITQYMYRLDLFNKTMRSMIGSEILLESFVTTGVQYDVERLFQRIVC